MVLKTQSLQKKRRVKKKNISAGLYPVTRKTILLCKSVFPVSLISAPLEFNALAATYLCKTPQTGESTFDVSSEAASITMENSLKKVAGAAFTNKTQKTLATVTSS